MPIKGRRLWIGFALAHAVHCNVSAMITVGTIRSGANLNNL